MFAAIVGFLRKQNTLRPQSTFHQILAFVTEFLVVGFFLFAITTLLYEDLTFWGLFWRTVACTLFLAVFVRMPTGWNTDMALIANGKDRWHDAVAPMSVAVLLLSIGGIIWLIIFGLLRIGIVWSFLRIW